jgi:hypothetical protein
VLVGPRDAAPLRPQLAPGEVIGGEDKKGRALLFKLRETRRQHYISCDGYPTVGRRSAQGCAFSSCAARRKSIASSPNGATNCTPTGSPAGDQ